MSVIFSRTGFLWIPILGLSQQTWDILLDSWFLLEYQIVLSSSEYWTSHGCSLIFMSHVFWWFQQLFSSRNLRYPAVRASREGGVLELLAILLHAHSQGYSSLTLSSWSSPNFLSWVSLLRFPLQLRVEFCLGWVLHGDLLPRVIPGISRDNHYLLVPLGW